MNLSREVPVELGRTALLVIDMQNYTARQDGGEYRGMTEADREATHGFFFRTLGETTLPNIRRLLDACRAAGIEIIYTVIESLTKDGRDLSLDYKISGLVVTRGSWDARVLDQIAPADDEIVLPKTSSSVFISTNIDYVLRNLGVRYLIVCGGLTDQCVDSAIRDACDLGYLVTCATDACATLTQDRHDWALRNNNGYCRQRVTTEIVEEIERLAKNYRIAGAG
ncbi:MAG: cysteine hydrolase [Alphaproteobacteria bacterium]|nr:cysteine hydrolase [Alphaproteobacteria bacterium]